VLNSQINSGDTAWMLASMALVLMMTVPGRALFYGAMVRKKNVLATLMQSFAITCALGYDDSLDAFGVHCIGGIVGALLTGVFASTALDGGQAGSVLTQLEAVAATIVYGFVASYILLKVIDVAIGLRLSEEDERECLDVTLHGEHVE
jgi:ammonia channel protein AmtB